MSLDQEFRDLKLKYTIWYLFYVFTLDGMDLSYEGNSIPNLTCFLTKIFDLI